LAKSASDLPEAFSTNCRDFESFCIHFQNPQEFCFPNLRDGFSADTRVRPIKAPRVQMLKTDRLSISSMTALYIPSPTCRASTLRSISQKWLSQSRPPGRIVPENLLYALGETDETLGWLTFGKRMGLSR